MGILDRILSGAGQITLGPGDRNDSADPNSPYPHPEAYDRTIGVYEVELRYQDGSTERVSCYTKPERNSDNIVLRRRAKIETLMQIGYHPHLEYDTRLISYQVLARDPIVRKIGSATFRVQYIQTGEDSYDGKSVRVRLVSRDIEGGDR